MIKLLFIMAAFRVASSDPEGITIDHHPDCLSASKDVRYIKLDTNDSLICIGKDTEYKELIFKNSFE